MALTQNRMIALLSTARRFYNDFTALKSTTRDIISALPLNPSITDCLNVLQSIQLSLDQFRPAEADVALLHAEEQHYRASFRRNQRAAEYARRRRAKVPTSLRAAEGDHELTETIISAGLDKKPVRHLSRKPLDQILPISKPTPDFPPLDQIFAQYNYSEPSSEPIDPDADLF